MINNFGILASISWNSNGWAGEPSKEDLNKSGYSFVQDEAHMHESLNFGHEKFPIEKGGMFIGYSPKLKEGRVGDNAKDVQVVFFVSTNPYKNSEKTIVGLYAFPELRGWFVREEKHRLFRKDKYDAGNLRAKVEHILHLDTPVVIDNASVAKMDFLPKGKKISGMGFNYLEPENVLNILAQMQLKNPRDKKLQSITKKLTEAVK